MKLIDSHCHLHDSEFYSENREEVYKRAIEAGIGMILVGTDERSSAEAVQFAATHDSSWAVVGVHPHESKMGYAMVEQLLRDSRGNDRSNIVGIGEIGLDYYYDHSPRDDQIRALEAQLQLAIDYNLPVSFHIRDAFDDFWPIFDNFHGIRGVMHSFTDNQANLERGFGRGLLVGVNGISTFTRDEPQVQMYATIPLDRMLLETDAPFLTPAPFRGTMNEPKYVERVARHMAEVRDLLLDDITLVTLENTKKLFRI
ncbi:MAG TPA: TatD family hydrolase [Candidatus Saccharibacteria bacterium]|jgi:TatD DNase family protein|nr:TatD family hydrolase [Candidatus Saccharibacteria bacterium]HMR38282.1 TatD family hydrolase [Candidatus Saccharibacteria bacterium]